MTQPHLTPSTQAMRPTVLDDNQLLMAQAACAQQRKLDAALRVTAMFLEASRPQALPGDIDCDNESWITSQYELRPKEEAAYCSALDYLERYFDTLD
jgi:hypothetical protein